MLLLLRVALGLALAAAFQVVPEFPATQQQPYTKNYVTLVVANASLLPHGTRFMKLVVEDGGPGNATALPLQWAAAGTTARVMFAPNNFTAQGAWSSTPAPSYFPPTKGRVRVHVEAWDDRVMAQTGGPAAKGRLAWKSSKPLDVFFDHTFTSIQFLKPNVTSLGAGEGLVEFQPHPVDAGRLWAAVELFFFCRVGPTGNHTADGVPIFSNNCASQYQFGSNRFRVAWTAPGIYYIALNGAWNGNTMHTVMLSPLNGIETALFPQVDLPTGADPRGRFQPLALIVPFENGTLPLPPRGFKGVSHVLPPIVGDRRIALTKLHLTWFSGAHFFLPLRSTAGGSLPSDRPWTPTVALDVDLPVGCELVNGSDSRIVPIAAAAGRDRVRLLPAGAAATGLSVMLSMGVLITDDAALVGTNHTVGFRALTSASLAAGLSAAAGAQGGG